MLRHCKSPPRRVHRGGCFSLPRCARLCATFNPPSVIPGSTLAMRDVQGLATNTCKLQLMSAAWPGCADPLDTPTAVALDHTAVCGAMLGSFAIPACLLQVRGAVPQDKSHTFWLKSFPSVRQSQPWLPVAGDTTTHANTSGQIPRAGPFLSRPPVYMACPC